jgi:tetratricopeptide (TPR) repeat protein
MNATYERAMLLHQQRRYGDAEQELKQLLSAEPHNADAHAMLSLCLLERKEYAQATEEADAAVGLAPDLSFAHYVRATVLTIRNRTDEAGAAITEALRLDPSNPAYYALQARLRMSQLRWPDALESVENGLSIDADDTDCSNLRAMALVQLGRREEAVAALGQSLARDPHDAGTHAKQGWAVLHQGQHQKALGHFREARRLDPELDSARSGMVEALKARHLVYRLMLKHVLWMSRMSQGMQWAFIIGLYVAFRFLAQVATNNPTLAFVIWPLVIAYFVFVYLTWIASPLFNLLLRVNRFGRYALSHQQKITSNWIGGSFLGASICAVAWAISGRADYLVATVFFMLMVLALAGMFRAPVGWPRRVMMLYTIALACIGAGAIAAFVVDAGQFRTLANAFLIGIFIQGWIANAVGGMRVKQ